MNYEYGRISLSLCRINHNFPKIVKLKWPRIMFYNFSLYLPGSLSLTFRQSSRSDYGVCTGLLLCDMSATTWAAERQTSPDVTELMTDVHMYLLPDGKIIPALRYFNSVCKVGNCFRAASSSKAPYTSTFLDLGSGTDCPKTSFQR